MLEYFYLCLMVFDFLSCGDLASRIFVGSNSQAQKLECDNTHSACAAQSTHFSS